MTQEYKQLLLQDLCARLPYKCVYSASRGITHWNKVILNIDTITKLINNEYNTIKPYLRPMSSMTDEESKKLSELPTTINNIGVTFPNPPYYIEVVKVKQIRWLLEKHFDFMGLIPKGLAIEVTKSNNPYKY